MGDPTAFFSRCSRVRVREAAASGFNGDETAGICSSSMRAAGSGAAELVGSCGVSAIVVSIVGGKLAQMPRYIFSSSIYGLITKQ